jgi:hypothetical protein
MKSLLKIAAVVVLSIILQTCKKLSLPDLKTENVSEITQISATSGGEVTDNGGNEVTARGVCWDTNKKPTVSSSTTTDGSGNGSFKSNITGLTANTTYYVRAYATNGEGVGYGNEVSFSTAPVAPGTGTITQPTCTIATGSVVITGLPATGEWTLTRTPGGTITTGTGTSTSITGLGEGTYTFTVTNNSGEVSVASGDVVINAQPTTPEIPEVVSITEPNCSVTTGSVALSGLPSTGTWTLITNPGATTTTGTGTNTNITGLSIGQAYTFNVINSVGCTSPVSVPAVITDIPKPSAVTNYPTNVTVIDRIIFATLNGSVNGNGSSTVVTFEYGTDTNYSGGEFVATQSPITGNSLVSVETDRFPLNVYHYRVKAVNCAGTTYGLDQIFQLEVIPHTGLK